MGSIGDGCAAASTTKQRNRSSVGYSNPRPLSNWVGFAGPAVLEAVRDQLPLRHSQQTSPARLVRGRWPSLPLRSRRGEPAPEIALIVQLFVERQRRARWARTMPWRRRLPCPLERVSLGFVSLSKHSNFENRTKSAEHPRAPERNGSFGEETANFAD